MDFRLLNHLSGTQRGRVGLAILMLMCALLNTAGRAQPGKLTPVRFEPTAINELTQRLRATRWTDQLAGSGWAYGTDATYLKEIVRYWASDYDWTKAQAAINQFKHYRIVLDGVEIDYIYERGKGPTPKPLVLLHGWPSSFVQMHKIIPMLTDPARYGSKAEESFDVIVPSLVGYGLSARPTQPGMTVTRMAELFQQLMNQQLKHPQFMVRASDIGAGVAKEWALAYPNAVAGLHLSGSNPYVYQMHNNLSEAERTFLTKGQAFLQQEGAYAQLQSTKPQTIAYALNDSPVGLAAWILEKFRTWSDCDGQLEKRFTKDELLTNLSLYWLTQTAGSSMRLYYESAHNYSPTAGKRVEVPTAMFMLAHDIAVGPREWEERSFNVQRWTVHPQGGHFAEWEEPGPIATDIRAFAASLRASAQR